MIIPTCNKHPQNTRFKSSANSFDSKLLRNDNLNEMWEEAVIQSDRRLGTDVAMAHEGATSDSCLILD